MGGDLLLGDTVDLEPKKTHFVNLNGIFDTMETSIKEELFQKLKKNWKGPQEKPLAILDIMVI